MTDINFSRFDLLTVADAAARLGVGKSRVLALIKEHNRRLVREAVARREVAQTIGRQVGGSGMWLLTAEEIEQIRPGPVGRPKKERQS